MDTLSFFRLLLPDDGVKFLAEWRPKPSHPRGGAFIHYPHTDLEAMADEAIALNAKGHNVYFACASYREVKYKTIQTKSGEDFTFVVGRTQENAVGARALWLDIDVGKANTETSYDTQAEAKAAVKLLCAKTGLHKPMVVGSGNGYHCYWMFDRFVEKAEWLTLVAMWRKVTTACGIKIDPSRDMDIASVLRPVGTHNPKGNRLVQLERQSEPKPPAFYRGLFTEVLGPEAAAVERRVVGNVIELKDNVFPPSSMERIAAHCQTVRWFKETAAAGTGTEPAWWQVIGVAKHCEDGEQLAHEWGSTDERYSYEDTQAKLDNWTAGPPLCATMREKCASCRGCTQAVSTPLALGYSETGQVGAAIPDSGDDAGSAEELASDTPTINLEGGPESIWIPQGFNLLGTRIRRMVTDDAGVSTPVGVAFPLFWPIGRVRLEDHTYAMRMKMIVRGSQVREFDLPLKNIVDNRSLKTALAANEIMVLNAGFTMEYLQSYSDQLRQHLAEVNTFDQYGWNSELTGILLGDVFFNGVSKNKVRLSARMQKVPELTGMYKVQGTKEDWIEGVDTLYNRENGEPHQYAVITQFGAWLCPLMESEEWNGIPLNLYSEESGYGKSTATKIAQNAIIRSTATTVTDATSRAVIGRASLMGSVPTLYDEVTKNIVGDDVSTVLYSLSNGRARIGMQSDGKEREPLPAFKQMSTMTSNTSSLFQVTESKVNPEAAQMRVFEIDLMDYPRLASLVEGSKMHIEHSPIVEMLLNKTSCVLTDEYFAYVIANKETIQQMLDKWYLRIKTKIGEAGGNAAKERFYARHIACAIVGGWIAFKLGFIRFDLPHLVRWAVSHVDRLRGYTQELRTTTEERLARMMSDFLGAMIVTNNYELLDARQHKVETPMITLRRDACVRVVLGGNASMPERGRVFVAVAAMDEWCKRNSMNGLEFRKALMNEGYMRLSEKAKPMYLARGVPSMPIGQQRCIELEYAKMQGIVSDVTIAVLPVAESVASKHKTA